MTTEVHILSGGVSCHHDIWDANLGHLVKAPALCIYCSPFLEMPTLNPVYMQEEGKGYLWGRFVSSTRFFVCLVGGSFISVWTRVYLFYTILFLGLGWGGGGVSDCSSFHAWEYLDARH